VAASNIRLAVSARSKSFLKIGHFNREFGTVLQDNYRAISSVLIRSCGSSKYQIKRGNVPRMDLQMVKYSMDGLLFFAGGRKLRIVAYNVSRTSALMHANGLGLLPISFYVAFDDFHTVGKCRLAWRYRDDMGVIFERWLCVRQRDALDQAH
jgi:hypothetical protein